MSWWGRATTVFAPSRWTWRNSSASCSALRTSACSSAATSKNVRAAGASGELSGNRQDAVAGATARLPVGAILRLALLDVRLQPAAERPVGIRLARARTGAHGRERAVIGWAHSAVRARCVAPNG